MGHEWGEERIQSPTQRQVEVPEGRLKSALSEVRRVGGGYKEIRVWSLETCLECAPQVRTVLTWRDPKEQGKTGALISMLCCDMAEVGEVSCPFLHLLLKN